jgi:hypothetical protein
MTVKETGYRKKLNALAHHCDWSGMMPWSACGDKVLMADAFLLFDKHACGLIELFKHATILRGIHISERA